MGMGLLHGGGPLAAAAPEGTDAAADDDTGTRPVVESTYSSRAREPARRRTMTRLRVRLLAPADAEEFVRVRGRALGEEPLAFSASPDDDRASDRDAVRTMLADPGRSAILGAFAPGLIGM